MKAVAGWLVALVVLIIAGRATAQAPTGLALMWPASGISVAWLLACRTRRDVGVAACAVFVVFLMGNVVTGVPLLAGVLLGLANLVIVGTTRALVRAVRAGSPRPFTTVATLADFTHLVVGVFAGAVASAPVGGAAVFASGGRVDTEMLVGWIVRNAVGALVVAGTVMIVRAGTLRRVVADVRGRRAIETAALVISSVAMVWLSFGPGRVLPLAFLPLVVIAWAGARYAPPSAVGFTVAVLMSTLILQLGRGGGPFAAIEPPGTQALVVQAYWGLCFAVAAMLSLRSAELEALTRRLHRAEAGARAQAEALKAITDTVPDGLVVVAADGVVALENPAAATILGPVPASELVGSDRLSWPDGEAIEPAAHPIQRALAGDSAATATVSYASSAGAVPRFFTLAAASIRPRADQSDADQRTVLIFRDVTAEHHRVQRLEGFAGVVAHDLQAPVAAVRGWAEILTDQFDDLALDDDGGTAESIRHIQSATERAQLLINDLLEYSTARNAALKLARLDLDALVDRVEDELARSAGARALTVTRGRLGEVMGDELMIVQLFSNLLGNATKYRRPEVDAEVQIDAVRAAGWVEISVADNGIGIPPEHRELVFEAFYRVPSRRRVPGTGLGLAICAQSVERHGGEIRVVGNGDQPGSRFLFTLPATRRGQHGEPPNAPIGSRASAAATASA